MLCTCDANPLTRSCLWRNHLVLIVFIMCRRETFLVAGQGQGIDTAFAMMGTAGSCRLTALG